MKVKSQMSIIRGILAKCKALSDSHFHIQNAICECFGLESMQELLPIDSSPHSRADSALYFPRVAPYSRDVRTASHQHDSWILFSQLLLRSLRSVGLACSPHGGELNGFVTVVFSKL